RPVHVAGLGCELRPVRPERRHPPSRAGLAMLGAGLLPESMPAGTTDTLAGFLASTAIFVSLTGVAYRPLRLIPLALVLALIALGMGGRHFRLATAAVFIGAASFAVGMAVAVITSHPLW